MSSDLEEVKSVIRKAALANAVKYEGKANPKAMTGVVMGQFPEYRQKMGEAMKLINSVVGDVNSMSLSEQESELADLGGVEKKEGPKDGLKELTDAKQGNVVMRFAPSPSGPMHIGHAITGGLSSLYVKKYAGKFILRIEDTNADNIDPDAYEFLKRDAKWIFGNVDEYVIQSERMDIYYDYAEKLLASGHLYVDTTDPEEFRGFVERKEDVPDKALPVEEHLSRWKQMLSGEIEAGKAVVRMRSDMTHKNPAMRDFPLFRINETTHPHVGDKYRVWPLMNFSVFVDDYTMGMTHVIRGKDHADNAKRQELLFSAVGAKPPVSYFIGRYKFEDMQISCSKTREAIYDGKYSGWDDIRVPFLEPLRRRGYQPEALLSFSKSMGLSKVDKTITREDFFSLLDSHNKDIIDPVAKRFYFVADPVEVDIPGLVCDVEIDLHPTAQKGGRKFSVDQKVLVEKEDAKAITSDSDAVIRLMDLANLQDGKPAEDHSYEFYKGADSRGAIMHWLIPEDTVKVSVLMPNCVELHGLGESGISNLSVGDVVQFERFGFCRLDSISDNGTYKFWFGHK